MWSGFNHAGHMRDSWDEGRSTLNTKRIIQRGRATCAIVRMKGEP